jgi:hypothetical protein
MVKSLEEELKVELIDRSARQIALTDAGEIVFNDFRKKQDTDKRRYSNFHFSFF